MIRGIHHTGVSTPDLERSLHFYRDLVGLQILSEGSWEEGWNTGDRIIGLENTAAKWVMLAAGNANLELFEFVSPQGASRDGDRPANDHGISHLCFEVEDIEALYARFRAEGVRFHCPPQDLEEMGKVTYARDPDGNIVELVEYVDGSEESLST